MDDKVIKRINLYHPASVELPMLHDFCKMKMIVTLHPQTNHRKV